MRASTGSCGTPADGARPPTGPQPTATPLRPPGSSSSLGGSNLIGYDHDNAVATDVPVDIPQSEFELAPGQSKDPDLGPYLNFEDAENFRPIRGRTKRPTDAGPRYREIEAQNSDFYAPPGTDDGALLNSKWPMGLLHNRHGLDNAGWSRQQNLRNLLLAMRVAGVDMAFEPWAYRELHWHKANERSIILNGSVRVQAVNKADETFNDDPQAGDSGTEFLLVFDQGHFSETNTGVVSEPFLCNPKAVLDKGLRVDRDTFKDLTKDQLFIFNGHPISSNVCASSSGPAGPTPKERTYSYHLSQQQPFEVDGGSVKIIDPLSFPIASNFAAALFTIKPGAMRELHWHTISDEWGFTTQCKGRLTSYEAPAFGNTVGFQAGDVGYVPVPNAHYLENTGTEDLVYIEILQAPVYHDISVAQWLGLTPDQVVRDHLGFSQETLARLPQAKNRILSGSTDPLRVDFGDEQE